jgi:ssDNA-binding Zn-finger/Zn-ribbon topoisomerase 1
MSLQSELTEQECPYCGEPIQLLIDPSVEEQTYVEDCQVCCRPMVVSATRAGDAMMVSVRHEDDG